VRATRFLRSTIADKAATRRSIEKILAWDFDRMIVTHGDVVRSGAKAEFARCLSVPARQVVVRK
jgi:hypothetical protein